MDTKLHAQGDQASMKMPPQITYRNMTRLPYLEPEIRRRILHLNQWAGELSGCHVVIDAAADAQGRTYGVKLVVHLPGHEAITADHQRDPDIRCALQRSFDAMDRQLEQFAQRRRGDTQPHPEAMLGRIVALWDDGIGHIVGSDGETYRFDRSHCVDPPFEGLALQRTVRFLPAWGHTGREARRVSAPTARVAPA